LFVCALQSGVEGVTAEAETFQMLKLGEEGRKVSEIVAFVLMS
jgi:hypothetical protein